MTDPILFNITADIVLPAWATAEDATTFRRRVLNAITQVGGYEHESSTSLSFESVVEGVARINLHIEAEFGGEKTLGDFLAKLAAIRREHGPARSTEGR